jgi:predicted RNA-binding Zn-ribbon protein involved in translation (DUF1610 family)
MPTQKAKFLLFSRLQEMGFTYDEAVKLRRIEMTLQRWFELECGDGNGRSIERDVDNSMRCTQCGHKHYGEDALTINCPKCGDVAPIRHKATDKPYMTYERGDSGERGRYPIADRELGARKRLAAIMASHSELTHYVQTDPRGCALYVLRKADVNGSNIDQVYNRGLAVCA